MNCSCLKHGDPGTCGTCRYGVCPRCTYPNNIECRRHAPVIVARPANSSMRDVGRYPETPRGGWCGDYEPMADVSRVELIDPDLGGRVYSRRPCAVQLSYQDDGRTLKVFVSPAPQAI